MSPLSKTPLFRELLNSRLFVSGLLADQTCSLSGAELTAQNDLSTNLGNLVKMWDQTVDTYNQQLFNGSDPSNDMLFNMITSGKLLEPGFTEDEGTVQHSLENAIYGFLIPQAWPLSNLNIRPVVMYGF